MERDKVLRPSVVYKKFSVVPQLGSWYSRVTWHNFAVILSPFPSFLPPLSKQNSKTICVPTNSSNELYISKFSNPPKIPPKKERKNGKSKVLNLLDSLLFSTRIVVWGLFRRNPRLLRQLINTVCVDHSLNISTATNPVWVKNLPFLLLFFIFWFFSSR